MVANLILHLYGCGFQTAEGLKAMLDAQKDDLKRCGQPALLALSFGNRSVTTFDVASSSKHL
jgi:hypothetical protein